MCGRYTLRTSAEELREQFGLKAAPLELAPRFNIAPSQKVPVVVNGGERKLELVRWGLIPFWAKDAKIGFKMINARAETLATKPAFRDGLKKRRCIVLADGFYEWRDGPLGRTPLHIRRPDGKPLAFAGLWDSWTPPEGEQVRSCTIVTTQANGVMAPIHDRMPAILDPAEIDAWLSTEAKDAPQLLELLRPYGGELVVLEASRLVNSPKNEGPALLEPGEPSPGEVHRRAASLSGPGST